ncbi:CATRA system-associated protein [Micromonospora sp. DH13]|uniref:CATRA system-associated protein n=2 Tax=Micromonosporaceae TaxID=28056 RepID=UPI00118308EE|nr:CATRA system-associated protein [Micromonospora sp. DH13]
MDGPEREASAARLDPRMIRDLISMLREAQGWRLTDGKWQEVGRLVEDVEKALAGGDDAALRRVIDTLEVAGEVRITRIGASTPQPVPPRLRDRLNRLVHQLSPSSGGRAGGAAGDRPSRC